MIMDEVLEELREGIAQAYEEIKKAEEFYEEGKLRKEQIGEKMEGASYDLEGDIIELRALLPQLQTLASDLREEAQRWKV